MNEQFGELVQQYEQAIKDADVQKQETLLSEMRQNIKERTNGVDNYPIEGKAIKTKNTKTKNAIY